MPYLFAAALTTCTRKRIFHTYTPVCVGTTVDESLAREFSNVPGMDVTFLDLSVTSLCLDHGDYLGK